MPAMSKAVLFVVCVVVAGAAMADEPRLEEFRERIAAALAVEDDIERLTAVETLFHHEGLDEWAEDLARRTAQDVAAMQGHVVTFEALSADTKTLFVVDGHEYRPNLEPLGYVVFTDPAAAPGNNTKALYGLPPGTGRYYLPLTTRTLVAPDAPPDKQLQIIVIGIAYPATTFEGWCDLLLSNGTLERVMLDDQGAGNQSRFMHGQSVVACKVTNTSARGSLSLRLIEDDDTIFEHRIEPPETVIVYPEP